METTGPKQGGRRFLPCLSQSRFDIAMEMICPNCRSRCQSRQPLADGTMVECPTCLTAFATPGHPVATTDVSLDTDFDPTSGSKPSDAPKLDPATTAPQMASSTKPCPFCGEL